MRPGWSRLRYIAKARLLKEGGKTAGFDGKRDNVPIGFMLFLWNGLLSLSLRASAQPAPSTEGAGEPEALRLTSEGAGEPEALRPSTEGAGELCSFYQQIVSRRIPQRKLVIFCNRILPVAACAASFAFGVFQREGDAPVSFQRGRCGGEITVEHVIAQRFR